MNWEGLERNKRKENRRDEYKKYGKVRMEITLN